MKIDYKQCLDLTNVHFFLVTKNESVLVDIATPNFVPAQESIYPSRWTP
jgi:hypothetical protein